MANQKMTREFNFIDDELEEGSSKLELEDDDNHDFVNQTWFLPRSK
jgi:hypothetical protein